MLPSRIFDAQYPLCELWDRADSVRIAIDSIDEIVAQLKGFNVYYRDGAWCDKRKRVFSFPHPDEYHGENVTDAQSIKFTYKVPRGFHYDVTHERNRTFEITDQLGSPRRFNDYTNVDPFGVIRGGK